MSERLVRLPFTGLTDVTFDAYLRVSAAELYKMVKEVGFEPTATGFQNQDVTRLHYPLKMSGRGITIAQHVLPEHG